MELFLSKSTTDLHNVHRYVLVKVVYTEILASQLEEECADVIPSCVIELQKAMKLKNQSKKLIYPTDILLHRHDG